MERSTAEGESPVHDNILCGLTKSRPGHVISWLNIGGPSSKAKYSLLTDSEQVP